MESLIFTLGCLSGVFLTIGMLLVLLLWRTPKMTIEPSNPPRPPKPSDPPNTNEPNKHPHPPVNPKR